MRRRAIIEPELRQSVCRWSQHRPWGEIGMILDEEDGSLKVDPNAAPVAPSNKPLAGFSGSLNRTVHH